MFRSKPERTLFGTIPVRQILLIILVLALTFTAMLVLGLEREKEAIQRILQQREGLAPEVLQLPFLKARADLIRTSAILFFLAVIGVTAILVHYNYYAIIRAFEETKTLARHILKSIATGVITLDRKGRVTSINPSAERLLDLESRSTAWRPYKEALRHHPELVEILQASLEDRAFAQEVELEVPAGLRSGPLSLRLSTSELRDEEGRPIGVVMLLRDSTELVQLERQLRHADKMAALGTLSAGLAHEIKNPLSALDLNLHLLEDELLSGAAPEGTVKGYLDVLKAEIRRLNAILENVIRFARPSKLVLSPLDLNEVLGQVIALILQEAREKKVEVETAFSPDLPLVMGDEVQLNQVFLNILINGLQAMPDGGRLEVMTDRSEAQPGFVEARFADTGVGIAPEHVGRLFDPYFTTRKEGTGLGLAIAYRIVKDHGGVIDLKGTPGGGTVVSVRLPCLRERV